MIPSLASRRDAIGALCRRFHVRRLDVFGSAAREEDFDPARSDIDFIVEYEPDHHPPAFADFLALRDALTALMERDVDLVMEGAVRNPYVRASIEASRQSVHAP